MAWRSSRMFSPRFKHARTFSGGRVWCAHGAARTRMCACILVTVPINIAVNCRDSVHFFLSDYASPRTPPPAFTKCSTTEFSPSDHDCKLGIPVKEGKGRSRQGQGRWACRLPEAAAVPTDTSTRHTSSHSSYKHQRHAYPKDRGLVRGNCVGQLCNEVPNTIQIDVSGILVQHERLERKCS